MPPALQKWKDAGGGQGIIHADGSEPTKIKPPKTPEINDEKRIHKHRESLQGLNPLSISASGDSSVTSALAHHSNTHSKDSNFFKRLKEKLTTAEMTDRLLRRTVVKNTWLYTAVSESPMRGAHGPDRCCEGCKL